MAELLIEVSSGNASVKRRIRLELASAQSPAEVGKEVRKRLTTIARSRSFVDWQNRRGLVDDLEAQRRAIHQVAKADPAEGLELTWRFMALANSVFARCDDSSGTAGSIFRAACHDLGDMAQAAKASPDALAERALKALDGSTAVSDQEMAQLEFMFLSVLADEEYGIPHLEVQLSQSSAMFMQAIGLAYRRSDEGEDPPEWRPPGSDESVSAIASQAFRLLEKAKRLPGTKPDGTIDVDDLKSWISEVSVMCKKYAREKVGGHMVGQYLAKCPVGDDGIWPSVAVRQALEEVGTKDILDGSLVASTRAAQYSEAKVEMRSATLPKPTAGGRAN